MARHQSVSQARKAVKVAVVESLDDLTPVEPFAIYYGTGWQQGEESVHHHGWRDSGFRYRPSEHFAAHTSLYEHIIATIEQPIVPHPKLPRLANDRDLAELKEWCRETIRGEIASLRVEIQGLLAPADRATSDAVSDWVAANSETLEKYRGQRVAIHPKLGVVAHGNDLAAVYEQVRAKGLVDEVTFDAVPSF